MLIIDYKQAYDTVNRETIWNTLIIFEVPTKIVIMIKLCMNKTRCKVKFNQHFSDEFEIKTGLQEGDTLSPVFFNIALETIINETQNKYGGLNLEDNGRQ